MARFGWCGPAYQSQSPDVDTQEAINFYTESDESGWGKTAVSMYGTPGTTLGAAIGGGTSRGCIVIQGTPQQSTLQRLFFVVGTQFVELFSGNVPIVRNSGTPFTGSGMVSMAASPLQILIIDNGTPYCYNLSSNTFQPLQTFTTGLGALTLGTYPVAARGNNYNIGDIVFPQQPSGIGGSYQVTALFNSPPHAPYRTVNGIATLVVHAGGSGYTPAQNVPLTGGSGTGAQVNISTTQIGPGSGMLANPIMCGYCDGFFLVIFANSQQLQCSQPLDASTWDPTQVTTVSVFTDNIASMLVDHRQVWLWGGSKAQVYYDSGNTFPFDPIPSGFIEQGNGAPLAPVRMDNSVFWLGEDERGAMVAWRANGYAPVRVSNHAVEYAWQGYPVKNDAIGYSMQYSGHAWWRIYFPSQNVTWVYDAATGAWHQLTSFNAGSGQFGAHRSNCHAYCFGNHFLGDPFSGNIWITGQAYFDDAGSTIQRIRVSPYIFREHKFIRHIALELDLEVGLGPQPPLTDGNGNPREPQLVLQWSDDQGKTWSNGRTLNCGFAGQYHRRVLAWMLGRSRGRVYKVTCTDPVPWRFADAYLRAEPNFQTMERLSAQIGKMG